MQNPQKTNNLNISREVKTKPHFFGIECVHTEASYYVLGFTTPKKSDFNILKIQESVGGSKKDYFVVFFYLLYICRGPTEKFY